MKNSKNLKTKFYHKRTNFIFIFSIIFLTLLPFIVHSFHFSSKKTYAQSVKTPIEPSVINEQGLLKSYFSAPVHAANVTVDDDYFNDVVLIGDSVTKGLEIYKTVKNAIVISKTGLNIESIINEPIDFNGDAISVIDAIKQSNRKKIYIMVGANGIEWLETDYMVRLYNQWLTNLRASIPNSVIYVQSVLPITEVLSNFNEKNNCKLTNQNINIYNEAIYNMCKQNYYHYLNVSEVFKGNDGFLPIEASPKDGIHINSAYYNVWINYIKSHSIDNETIQYIQTLMKNLKII